MSERDEYHDEFASLDVEEANVQKEINEESARNGLQFWVLLSVGVVLLLWIGGIFFPWIIREVNQHGIAFNEWKSWLGNVQQAENSSQVPGGPQENSDLSNWGLTGDSFGVVNALFSGLAFSFVIVGCNYHPATRYTAVW